MICPLLLLYAIEAWLAPSCTNVADALAMPTHTVPVAVATVVWNAHDPDESESTLRANPPADTVIVRSPLESATSESLSAEFHVVTTSCPTPVAPSR